MSNKPNSPIINERQTADWDFKNAFGNYFTLAISHIFLAIFSFASILLLTRSLGKVGYGGVVVILSASSLIQTVVNWTAISVVRYGIEEFIEFGKINKSFWGRIFIFLPNTIILFCFSILWMPTLLSWLEIPHEAKWAIILHFLTITVWYHFQCSLQGAKLPKISGILVAFEKVVVFLLLLLLTISNNLTYLSAIYSYIISSFTMTCISIFFLRPFLGMIEYDLTWIKKLFKFSVPLIPFTVIGYFSTNYLDAIFISQYLKKEDLGVYQTSYQIMGLTIQFLVLANTLLLPLFVTLNKNKQEELLTSYFRSVLPVSTLFWGFICVCIATIGTIIIPFIFGSDFDQSGELFFVLMISSIINAPLLLGYAPLSNALSASYIGLLLILSMALVNVVGNIFLIPHYGLIGSVWATNFSYAISILVGFFFAKSKIYLKRDWTLVAMFPSVLGLSLASLKENFFLAIPITLIFTILLIILYYNSVKQSASVLLRFIKNSKVA